MDGFLPDCSQSSLADQAYKKISYSCHSLTTTKPVKYGVLTYFWSILFVLTTGSPGGLKNGFYQWGLIYNAYLIFIHLSTFALVNYTKSF